MDVDCILPNVILVLFGVVLRCGVAMNSYSGAGMPPMFGDYEAQRHWMEITLNLPAADWYKQTDDNDLMYWGLDYPPLTAYHSKLCGYIASFINRNWTLLHASRGFESYHHKLFMRYSVLFVDVLLYIPAIFWFYSVTGATSNRRRLAFVVALCYPGLILIDHGHFQYNCVSLGLAAFAITLLLKGVHVTGGAIFVLALNYKQMELYHSLPFFFYLLGIALRQRSWALKLWKLVGMGVAVLVTFALCWLPFLMSLDSMQNVLRRLFPFDRGLYEDKVANLWCSLSVLVKMKNLLKQEQMVKVCLLTTFAACAPSCFDLLRFPTKKKFLYSLINCSLGFFLFSFQVHEKSILIVALPVCLMLLHSQLAAVWFLAISTFSMYPLLERDGQAVSYFALMVLFLLLSSYTIDWLSCPIVIWTLLCVSLCCALLIHLSKCFIQPPAKLPDLYPLLFSVYSCAHFLLFWLHFNYNQLTSSGDDVVLEALFSGDDGKYRKKIS